LRADFFQRRDLDVEDFFGLDGMLHAGSLPATGGLFNREEDSALVW
jgi:hypothetical protein